MKLNNQAKTFETNAEFKSQDFGIGDASVVIEILRNRLYKHKIRTLVQEYISNGRDAMREAKSKKRIMVTAPTRFEPTFKVRDFGLGVDPKRMSGVFVLYGASTKRNSNTQTGGFGIGAKSAWAYTDSFTIITYIKGIQRTYIAHTGANNNGRLDFLGETPTTEADGTEIQIPVSPADVTQFVNAIHRATLLWTAEEKPELTNLKPMSVDINKIVDNVGVINSNKIDWQTWNSLGLGNNSTILAIDGIPYVLTDDHASKIKGAQALTRAIQGQLVLTLSNGDVEVSASREEIADSQATKDFLVTEFAKIIKAVETNVKAEFAKAKDTFSYLKTFVELSKTYNMENYSKYGEFTMRTNGNISSNLFEKVNAYKPYANSDKVEKSPLYKAKGRSRYSSDNCTVTANEFNNIYYHDGSESKIVINHRIRELLETVSHIVVIEKDKSDDTAYKALVKGLGAKNLKDVSYTVKPKAPREVIVREKQEFCIHDLSSYGRGTKFITCEGNDQKYLYVEMDGNSIPNQMELKDLNNYFEHVDSKYKICGVSKKSLSMIEGDKNFKPLKEFMKDYELSKKELQIIKRTKAKNSDMIVKLSGLASKIDDKFLKARIVENMDLPAPYSELPEAIEKLAKENDDIKEFEKNDKELSKLFETKWPLLNHIQWYSVRDIKNELTAYINAK